MKLTNLLLIILICLLAYKIPANKKTVSLKDEGITVGKRYTETRSIKPKVLEKAKNRHSTTFREYIDNNGRMSTSLNHSIRVGKEYYISGGASVRESSYGKQNIGGTFSITKYW